VNGLYWGGAWRRRCEGALKEAVAWDADAQQGAVRRGDRVPWGWGADRARRVVRRPGLQRAAREVDRRDWTKGTEGPIGRGEWQGDALLGPPDNRGVATRTAQGGAGRGWGGIGRGEWSHVTRRAARRCAAVASELCVACVARAAPR
jgi:hypothetical protein